MLILILLLLLCECFGFDGFHYGVGQFGSNGGIDRIDVTSLLGPVEFEVAFERADQPFVSVLLLNQDGNTAMAAVDLQTAPIFSLFNQSVLAAQLAGRGNLAASAFNDDERLALDDTLRPLTAVFPDGEDDLPPSLQSVVLVNGGALTRVIVPPQIRIVCVNGRGCGSPLLWPVAEEKPSPERFTTSADGQLVSDVLQGVEWASHLLNNTYVWSQQCGGANGGDADGEVMVQAEADCRAQYGHGFRIPRRIEHFNIFDHKKGGVKAQGRQAIGSVFNPTGADWDQVAMWTSTRTRINPNDRRYFAIYTWDGAISYNGDVACHAKHGVRMRCMRHIVNKRKPEGARYVDAGPDLVLDRWSGLEWQVSLTEESYRPKLENFLAPFESYCAGRNMQVPTIKELALIHDESRVQPTWDRDVFGTAEKGSNRTCLYPSTLWWGSRRWAAGLFGWYFSARDGVMYFGDGNPKWNINCPFKCMRYSASLNGGPVAGDGSLVATAVTEPTPVPSPLPPGQTLAPTSQPSRNPSPAPTPLPPGQTLAPMSQPSRSPSPAPTPLPPGATFAPSFAPTPSSADQIVGGPSLVSSPALLGGAIGGGVLLCLIIFVVLFVCASKRRRQSHEPPRYQADTNMIVRPATSRSTSRRSSHRYSQQHHSRRQSRSLAFSAVNNANNNYDVVPNYNTNSMTTTWQHDDNKNTYNNNISTPGTMATTLRQLPATPARQP